jgi:hypothetical protein
MNQPRTSRTARTFDTKIGGIDFAYLAYFAVYFLNAKVAENAKEERRYAMLNGLLFVSFVVKYYYRRMK